jgi:hypothetical protein
VAGANLGEHPRPEALVAGVPDQRLRHRPAGRLIDGAGDLRRVGAPVHQRHGLDAAPGQLAGGGLANAAGGAGHERDLPLDLHGFASFPSQRAEGRGQKSEARGQTLEEGTSTL